MRVAKFPSGFYIVDTPDGVDKMGPYSKLSDAQDDMEGVERFLKNENRRSFFTITK